MLVAIVFIKPNDGYTPPAPVAEKKAKNIQHQPQQVVMMEADLFWLIFRNC
jgi:hypothetical protein